MFFRNKLRRRPQANTTPVQALESRALMTGTGSVIGAIVQPIYTEPVVTTPKTSLTNGELKITGTSGNDTLAVRLWDRVYLGSPLQPYYNQVQVVINGNERFYDSTTLNRINISMLGGDDTVLVDGYSVKELSNISIDMGTGVKEVSSVLYAKTGDLSIQSGGSAVNDIYIGSTTVRGNAFIDTSKTYSGLFGWLDGCTGADIVTVSGSSIYQMFVTTGNANDQVKLSGTRAEYTQVSLGSGNDSVDLQSSNLTYGIIVGGAGEDWINTYGTYFGGSRGGFEASSSRLYF